MKLVLLISIILTSFAHAKVSSFKGWELYFLEKKDSVKFALLEGTNVLKSVEEVSSKASDLDILISELDNLKEDEFVSLSNRFVNLKNTIPEKYKKSIIDLCKRRKLNCFLGE
jgi:hypothetical protein